MWNSQPKHATNVESDVSGVDLDAPRKRGVKGRYAPSKEMTRTDHCSIARGVDTLLRMYERQQALAAEIRAESAAQRITAKEIQDRIGVSSSACSNYFGKKIVRDVPMSVVADVAEVLGMDDVELLTRARARFESSGSPSVDRTTAELEAGLSRSGRRALEQARREAGEGGVDPRGRARADQDDGIGYSATA